MGRRSREEVFTWAAAQTAADQRPSLSEMAAWGSRGGDTLSKSTVASWVRRHGDPRTRPTEDDADPVTDAPSAPSRPEGGVHTPANPTAHPCTPPAAASRPAPAPPASPGGCTPPPATTCHFPGLSPQQERAVFLKAQGMNHTAIAEAVGVNRHTIADWQHLPAFAAALSELRAEAHIVSREALLAGAQESIAGTREIQRVMLAIVQGDAVALSPDDLRLRDAGERFNVILDPRLQIQAARTYIQASRTLMDRGGFHPKAELHLAGEGGGLSLVDFTGLDDDTLNADLDADLAALEADERRLRLLQEAE